MVTFAGVAHAALTVTDLEVSRRFYTEVLDFVGVIDLAGVRVLIHPGTGFTLALVRPPDAHGGRFDERTTGLDHLGLAAASRAELEEWERRFDALGVTYTPILDRELGHHLNFRDPDGIALELYVPNELMAGAAAALASGEAGRAEIDAFIAANLGADHVTRSPSP